MHMGRPRLARTCLYLSNRRVAVSLFPYAHYAEGTDGTYAAGTDNLTQPAVTDGGSSFIG